MQKYAECTLFTLGSQGATHCQSLSRLLFGLQSVTDSPVEVQIDTEQIRNLSTADCEAACPQQVPIAQKCSFIPLQQAVSHLCAGVLTMQLGSDWTIDVLDSCTPGCLTWAGTPSQTLSGDML